MKVILTETKRGKINSIPILAGQLLYCTDSQEVFYDNSKSKRILFNSSVIILNTESERENILPIDNKIYIVVETHNVYFYYLEWICLNSVIFVPDQNPINKDAIETVITLDGNQYSPKTLTNTIYDKNGINLEDLLNNKADKVHKHMVKDISDMPTSFPANGGTSSYSYKLKNPPKINDVTFEGDKDITITADPNVHEHTVNDIINFPSTMKADGGNSDTVDNKHADDFAPSKFGLGEEYAADIGSANVDNIFKGGLYYSMGGNLNAPEAGSFVLTVSGKPYILQSFIFINTYNVYYRIFINDKWVLLSLAQLKDIPLTLPANGGNSDRLGGRLADEYALKYTMGYKSASDLPSDWNKGMYWSSIDNNNFPCTKGKVFTLKDNDGTIAQLIFDNESNNIWIRNNTEESLDVFTSFRKIVFEDQAAKNIQFQKDVSGNSTIYNNGDNIKIDITVNKAAKLTTPANISLSGDVIGNIDFDGSKNVILNTILKTVIEAGTYFKTTVDDNGRVIEGSNPTTLDEFGITDAVNISQVDTTPTAGKILPLDNNKKLPTDITGDAQSLQGKVPADFATDEQGDTADNAWSRATDIYNLIVSVASANKLLKLDANSKLPASITGDAHSLQGKVPTDFATDEQGINADSALALANTINNLIVSVASANKLLKLDANSKLPASITGDAHSLQGKVPTDFATNIQGATADSALSKVNSLQVYMKNLNAGTSTLTSIAIPTGAGYSSSTDTIIIFKNRALLFQGIDYNISSDNKTINSISTDGWSSNGASSLFTFVVIKNLKLTLL